MSGSNEWWEYLPLLVKSLLHDLNFYTTQNEELMKDLEESNNLRSQSVKEALEAAKERTNASKAMVDAMEEEANGLRRDLIAAQAREEALQGVISRWMSDLRV